MMNEKRNRFTQADVGISVVFAGFDGGSYSAKVVEVRRDKPNSVRIAYFPVDARPVFATIVEPDFHRLTRFPGTAATDKFLVING
jgi:hypothetical protein